MANIFNSNWIKYDINANNNNAAAIISQSFVSNAMSMSGEFQTALALNGGIWISSNYSVTWSKYNLDDLSWCSVSMSETGQYQTAVAAGSGIWLTSNYGINWYNILPNSLLWTYVSISASGKYQTAVTNADGLWRSSNYGMSWYKYDNALTNSLSWTSVSISGWDTDFKSSGVYQTAVTNGGGIWRSVDYGKTWDKIGDVSTNSLLWTSISISASGVFQTATAGGGGIWMSHDSGLTWNKYDNVLTNSLLWTSVSVSNTGQYQIAVSNGGGIWMSIDSGLTWSKYNNLITNRLQFTSIAISASGKYITSSSSIDGIWRYFDSSKVDGDFYSSAEFLGDISGNTLTVSNVVNGKMRNGQLLTSTTYNDIIKPNTYVNIDSYGNYTVTVSQLLKSSLSLLPPLPPHLIFASFIDKGITYTDSIAPTSLSCNVGNDIGSGNVKVNFTGVTDTIYPTSNYKYYYYIDGSYNNYRNDSSWNTFSPSITASPVTISGLTDDVSYNIYLRAVNFLGDGTPSQPIAAKPTDSSVKPDAPFDLSCNVGLHIDIGSLYSQCIQVIFTPGSTNGLTGVKYQYTLNNIDWDAATNTQPYGVSGKLSFIIYNRVNGTSYSIRVRATDSKGVVNSVPSAPISATPIGPPDAPQSFDVDASYNLIIISNIRDGLSNGGAVITGYEYIYYSNDISSNWIPFPRTFDSTTNANTTSTSTPTLNYGQTYYITLRAVNSDGQKSVDSSTRLNKPIFTPGPPSSFQIDASDSSIIISNIIDGSANGSAIIGYNYSYSLNNIDWEPDASLNNLKTISLLQNGITYYIKLRAINSVGLGVNYTISTPSYVIPYGKPFPPTDLSYSTGSSSGTVDISFTRCVINDSSSNFLKYEYCYDISGGYRYIIPNNWTDISTNINATSFSISGLTYHPYDIRARTRKKDGTVSESSLIRGVTPFTVPSAPTDLSSTVGSSVGSGTVTISFTDSLNGSTFSKYEYYRDISGGSNYLTQPWTTISTYINTYISTNINTISFSISGLSYQLYDIRVRTRSTNAGVSDWNVISVTPFLIPSAPTDLSSTVGFSSGTIKISFTDSSSNGSPITRYEYFSSVISANWITCSPAAIIISPITSYVTISGLQNGTTYTIFLRAVNSIGDGDSSSSISATPIGPPDAPQLFDADASNNSIIIRNIINGSSNGAVITGYEYYSSDISTNWISFNTSTTISNLTNGNSYNILLRSVNSMGPGPSSSKSYIIPYGKPLAPTIISTQPADKFVNILFTVVSTSNGRPINNYEYFSSDISTNWITCTSPIIIYGLTNGKEYSVNLRAVNSVKINGDESIINFIPNITAGKPIINSITPTNLSIIVSFKSDDTTINGYQYYCDISSNVENWINKTPTDDPSYNDGSKIINIPNLTNGTLYYVSIRTHNSSGYSVKTNELSVTPYGNPFPPTDLSYSTGLSSGTVDISFTRCVINDSSSNFLKYEYCYDISGGYRYIIPNNWTDISTNINATSFSISGLTYHPYDIRARTRKKDGTVSESSLIRGVIPFLIPSAPTDLSSTVGFSSGTIKISFTDSSSNGSPITRYEYFSSVISANWITCSPAAIIISPITSYVTISGLQNGTTYTIFLRAVNSIGDGDSSSSISATPKFTPDPPTGLSSTVGLSSGTVKISFTSGSANGSSITNYKYSIDNGINWIICNPDVITSPIIITTGLQNGTTYSIKLRAINSVGDSIDSSACLATPKFTPSPPQSFQIDASDSSIIISNIIDGSTNGSAIVGYNYSYSLNNIDWTPDASLNNLKKISPLQNSTLYYIKLRAINSVGPGVNYTISTPSSVIPYGKPFPPTGLSYYTGITSGTVTITFTPGFLNGSTFANYEYYCDFSGGSNYLTQTWTSAVYIIQPYFRFGMWAFIHSFSISSLTYQPYDIRLRIRSTNAGASDWKLISVTPFLIPSAPTALSSEIGLSAGSGKIKINFTPSSANGSSITNYKYSIDNGTTWIPCDPVITASPITISGLQNGTTYSNIKLRAVNSIGDGTPSSSISATPIFTPDKPIITSIDCSGVNFIVNFTFTSGSDNGSPITNYNYSIDNGITWITCSPTITTSPITISGTGFDASNKKPFSIKIQAVNGVGSGTASDIFSPTLSNKTGIPFTSTSNPTNEMDDGYYNIDVSGKNFSFKGINYSYLSIGTNGYFQFLQNTAGRVDPAATYNPFWQTTANTSNLIKFFNSDLYVGSAVSPDSYACYYAFDISNTKLLIDLRLLPYNTRTSTNNTFNIILEISNNGIIKIYYKSIISDNTFPQYIYIGLIGDDSNSTSDDFSLRYNGGTFTIDSPSIQDASTTRFSNTPSDIQYLSGKMLIWDFSAVVSTEVVTFSSQTGVVTTFQAINNINYKFIQFYSNNTINVSQNIVAYYIVVGAGAGGLTNSTGSYSGGGGAGGCVVQGSIQLSSGAYYTITIGNGGAISGNGELSSINSIQAPGGVVGSTYIGGVGTNGGGSGGNGQQFINNNLVSLLTYGTVGTTLPFSININGSLITQLSKGGNGAALNESGTASNSNVGAGGDSMRAGGSGLVVLFLNTDYTYSGVQPFQIMSNYFNAIIKYVGGYFYITFTRSSSIVFSTSLSSSSVTNNFNALVVGGGGGGGGGVNRQYGIAHYDAGGGGGGGAAARLNMSVLTNTTYNIVVGTGGGGGPGNLSGVSGTESSFKNGSTNIITCGGGGFGTGRYEGILGGPSGIITTPAGITYESNGGGKGGNGSQDNDPLYIASDGSGGSQFTLPSADSYYFSGGGGGGGGGGSQEGYPLGTFGTAYTGTGGSAGNGVGGPKGISGSITSTSVNGVSATNYGGGGGGGGINTLGNPSTGGAGGSGLVILYFKYP